MRRRRTPSIGIRHIAKPVSYSYSHFRRGTLLARSGVERQQIIDAAPGGNDANAELAFSIPPSERDVAAVCHRYCARGVGLHAQRQ